MPDIGQIVTADPALTVTVGGTMAPAVTVTGSPYVPTPGDTVVLLPLSNGILVVLGPS